MSSSEVDGSVRRSKSSRKKKRSKSHRRRTKSKRGKSSSQGKVGGGGGIDDTGKPPHPESEAASQVQESNRAEELPIRNDNTSGKRAKKKKKPTPWESQREILRTPPTGAAREGSSVTLSAPTNDVYMPITAQDRQKRHEKKLQDRIAKRERQMEHFLGEKQRQQQQQQQQQPSLFLSQQLKAAAQSDNLPALAGRVTQDGSTIVSRDANIKDEVKDEDWEDETFECDDKPRATDTHDVRITLDPQIAALLSKLEFALKNAIESEDFYSASQLQRIRPKLYRRGIRLTKLELLKRDAVAAEDFDAAIKAVEKADVLRKFTFTHLRKVAVWRNIEGSRKDQEHMLSHVRKNKVDLGKEQQLEIFNVGDFVEARLEKWDTNEWYKGQIVQKDSQRAPTDLGAALPSSFSYSVRFLDPNMMRKFKFVGSTDIVGRIIEGILPGELRTSVPEPPMARPKGREYYRRKQRENDSRDRDGGSASPDAALEAANEKGGSDSEKESSCKTPSVDADEAMYKIGQIVEAQLEGWAAFFGGKIVRYEGKGRYSILFDDLDMQRELRSRVQRRVIEGVAQTCIRRMERSRFESYEKQYDRLYGKRARLRTQEEKDEDETRLKEEEAKRKTAKRFFGRVGDVFEAKLAHWNTWYAGRIMSKDEALGLVSIHFDDIRLEDGTREIKHGRVLEGIPRDCIRPVGTGRLRLYKDLKSSLKLLKSRVKKQKSIEEKNAAEKALSIVKLAEKHSHHAHHHHVHHPHHMPDFNWSVIRPSEIAEEIAKESDWLIARALHGLPPPALDYMHTTLLQSPPDDQESTTEQVKEEEEAADSDSDSDTDVSSSDEEVEEADDDTSYTGDMPEVGSIVAAVLQTRAGVPWRRPYCGVVTGVNPPKIIPKAKPLHQVLTKKSMVREVKKATNVDLNRAIKSGGEAHINVKVDAGVASADAPIAEVAVVVKGEWSVDVKFDDMELAIEMEWPEGKLDRVIERLHSKDLVRLDKERLKRYEFMKTVWLKRQSDVATKREKSGRVCVPDEEDKEDKSEESLDLSGLSYFEKLKIVRKQHMDRFCSALKRDKGFFPVDRRTIGVPKLDEFGFPCISDSDEESEDEAEAKPKTPPPFVIMRGTF